MQEYFFAEERVVVTQETVGTVEVDGRQTAFALFEAFCAKHQRHPNTQKMVILAVDSVTGKKVEIGSNP